jgi:tetratricopeptide (TPR) repeat protein
MSAASPPLPPLGSDLNGWETTALLASSRDATIYQCHHGSSSFTSSEGGGTELRGGAALAIICRHGSHLGLKVHLPKDMGHIADWRDPSRPDSAPSYVVMVRGQDGTARLVDALWQWGRDTMCSPEWWGGLHYTHGLASQLLGHAMRSVRGLRVGDKALEPREVKGSGYFSIALAARLVGAGEEAEDVAVKVFVGRGAQGAFEAELRTLRTLTAKVGPAALVVRLVGVVEQRGGEGEALPWPALVMTPLCVESLEQRIDRFDREPYTLQQALAWAGQVALSLHRLHRESRLRHGDATLRNVLLGRDGRAYLADMGVAEHNHPYGRQPQQEGQGKGYSASVAPEMVVSSQSSDARADVWSWGVLLHALLTRSTAMAKGHSISEYLTSMKGEWWEEAAALWGPEEPLPGGVLSAVKHSLCERGERVGLLAGAVLLGQQGLVEEMVGGMGAPAEVKEAELRIAMLESRLSSTEPSSRPELLITLAESHTAVGDETQAIACLQQALRLCAYQSDDGMHATILHKLGVALDRRGDHKEAVLLLTQVTDMRRRLLPGDDPMIAKALSDLGDCRYHQGEYGKAVSLLEEALAMQRRVLPEDHLDIAISLNTLANCCMRQADYGRAMPLYETVLAVRQRLLPEVHPDIATSLNNLAACHENQGEYDKAIPLQEEALAMERQLLPGDHRDIAIFLNNLATCHTKQGDYDKAISLYEEAIAMMRRSLPEDHPNIPTVMHNLAKAYIGQGNHGRAIEVYDEALAIWRRMLPEAHPEFATCLEGLADCHESQGEYDKAALLHEHALAMRRRLLPEDHPFTLRSLRNLADCHANQGAHGQAAVLLEEALAMRRRVLPEDPLEIATILNNLATCLDKNGESRKAMPLFEEALAIGRRLLPADHIEIAISLANLASCHLRQDDYGNARRLHEEALAMRRRLLPGDHPDIADSLHMLASCHARSRDHGTAVILLGEALAIRQRLLPEDHPEVGRCHEVLGGALLAAGDGGGATIHLKMAEAILSKGLPPDHPDLRRLARVIQRASAQSSTAPAPGARP